MYLRIEFGRKLHFGFLGEGVVVLQVGVGARGGENCKVISETGMMHL